MDNEKQMLSIDVNCTKFAPKNCLQSMFDPKNIQETFHELFFIIAPRVLLAFVLLILGSWLIKLFMRYIHSRFEKRDVEPSLRLFLSRIIKIGLYIVLILSIAGNLGIQTTSFLAVLGGAGLAIGLALQGSLSNFAGGVLILLFKPFRIGDYISSTSEASGTVENIDLLYTTLRTAEGTLVFAPNGPLANSVITNYSNLVERRVEYSIDLSYDSDTRQIRDVILDLLRNDQRVLTKPAPEVLVNGISNGAVKLVIRYWSPKGNYWNAYHDIFEKIKTALKDNQVTIPQYTIQALPLDDSNLNGSDSQ